MQLTLLLGATACRRELHRELRAWFSLRMRMAFMRLWRLPLMT